MLIKNVLMDTNEGLYIDLSDILNRLKKLEDSDTPVEKTTNILHFWSPVQLGNTYNFKAWKLAVTEQVYESHKYTDATSIDYMYNISKGVYFSSNNKYEPCNIKIGFADNFQHFGKKIGSESGTYEKLNYDVPTPGSPIGNTSENSGDWNFDIIKYYDTTKDNQYHHVFIKETTYKGVVGISDSPKVEEDYSDFVCCAYGNKLIFPKKPSDAKYTFVFDSTGSATSNPFDDTTYQKYNIYYMKKALQDIIIYTVELPDIAGYNIELEQHAYSLLNDTWNLDHYTYSLITNVTNKYGESVPDYKIPAVIPFTNLPLEKKLYINTPQFLTVVFTNDYYNVDLDYCDGYWIMKAPTKLYTYTEALERIGQSASITVNNMTYEYAVGLSTFSEKCSYTECYAENFPAADNNWGIDINSFDKYIVESYDKSEGYTFKTITGEDEVTFLTVSSYLYFYSDYKLELSPIKYFTEYENLCTSTTSMYDDNYIYGTEEYNTKFKLLEGTQNYDQFLTNNVEDYNLEIRKFVFSSRYTDTTYTTRSNHTVAYFVKDEKGKMRLLADYYKNTETQWDTTMEDLCYYAYVVPCQGHAYLHEDNPTTEPDTTAKYTSSSPASKIYFDNDFDNLFDKYQNENYIYYGITDSDKTEKRIYNILGPVFERAEEEDTTTTLDGVYIVTEKKKNDMTLTDTEKLYYAKENSDSSFYASINAKRCPLITAAYNGYTS